MSEIDPFEGMEPIAGLEHLGRAIVDSAGVPSGSPANYEETRGKGAPSLSEEDKQRILADLATEFATDKEIPEAHPWANDPESNITTPD